MLRALRGEGPELRDITVTCVKVVMAVVNGDGGVGEAGANGDGEDGRLVVVVVVRL